MRLGVFGGTFDPPHIGHLAIAEAARTALALDRVLFVPAGAPPHKALEAVTPATVRLEMVRAAIHDNSAFDVTDLELRRAGPSYTIDTLELVHATRPDADLYCLVGSDSAVQLHTWHDPARLYAAAVFAVLMRPGWPEERLDAWMAAQPPGARPRLSIVEVPLLDVASSDLRQRIAQGQSVRYLVPEAVMAVIERHRLYRVEPAPPQSPDNGAVRPPREDRGDAVGG